ncbi:hypothetical protein C5167_019487 [Papaver somniferum]|uniref:Ent-kaurenoic acid oxidase n=1 Tax=Papaver somniferum TaxID=3469 RepID=A0A4Y7ITN3_PAPSO|nr:ent-kaurenoic acid oxidase 1-like [Papaver somniferum]RZC51062.1 hypothetical protein C5167_019487 [Papaver somniferum]
MELVESSFSVVLLTIVLGGIIGGLYGLVKKANEWYYGRSLGDKRFLLPPGDMGLPIFGNMFSFLRAFKSGNPDRFISNFVKRYNRIGMYKAYMFGSPTILITTPETCRQVLMDEERFKPGWPKAANELMGRKSFIAIPYEEHKRLRRITAAPVNGHEALSVYLTYIEETVISTLDKWSNMGEIEFLTHLRKLTFRIITYIFLSSEGNPVVEALEKEYTHLNYGVRAMAINYPGFAYYKALKARKKLVVILQTVLDERRERRARLGESPKKDMMDNLINVEDEKGIKLTDEDIIDILIMYLNAGHESSGHITMWATAFLQANPECFKKAKAEQEEIVRNRSPAQKGLTLKEIRQMDYLSQVVDETLRVVNISSVVFREALTDIKMNGYLIPKGWKVQVWFRTVHMDPEVYPNPKEFNPSRWDNYTPKAGTYLPFGAGSRLCPGNDLAKLEIMIFLHHFILNYQLERTNPDCKLMYLPHPRPKDNCLARVRKVSV